MNNRLLGLLAGTVLLGCGHTLPKQPDLDRATGPWSAGPPTQLTAAAVSVIGFTADGRAILIHRHDPTRVTGPDGEPRLDSSEIFLGLLPAMGGSGLWEFSDERTSQRDSINDITAAALAPDGRILYVETTGPDPRAGYPFPIHWHTDLYLSDTADMGHRRKLLQLFDEDAGHALVPPGTINWLRDLAWIDSNHFTAIGTYQDLGFGSPLQPRPIIGPVIGTVTSDGAILTAIPDAHGVALTAVMSGHRLLVVENSRVRAYDYRADEYDPEVPIPQPPGGAHRQVTTAACARSGCTLITRDAGEDVLRVWSLPLPGADSLIEVGTVDPRVSGRGWISPADGSLLVNADAAYRIELPSSN